MGEIDLFLHKGGTLEEYQAMQLKKTKSDQSKNGQKIPRSGASDASEYSPVKEVGPADLPQDNKPEQAIHEPQQKKNEDEAKKKKKDGVLAQTKAIINLTTPKGTMTRPIMELVDRHEFAVVIYGILYSILIYWALFSTEASLTFNPVSRYTSGPKFKMVDLF